ncbi:3-deoxy-7-phosphoheptulonate synthase [Clostridium estertheticum]|uniref:Phospho-2-dehydro-3-deoxyheptonate aldolase n=1 Tax=Clostridium estertheticum subsp. estertheticum TaxID=1552 RepID=A0A1J0GCL7_9CLOT|nr:3-deoxy-7-phosphoheptulonate synthase [Clostridium estertheticum]APC39097.1 3-deoxy-7-phosphoheptulonate synthase [Clostridium estertheticum subsp. estertheticum]MBU3075000.1 3-deoxy-7-phosphoheptulonate synthase [Clostridium estertheticum]MBU3165215.1 3-deoxy-7-phosphoheptulonate synthase [Clostridium estertheticum]MBU3173550.1 3-deoxy-7-phosphoheptulonate synthase [Clostridium estertheticum]MBZ9614935.1 3-deoxy-7-phosphoheptulonate synthase [Clostridium estertheticum subsp. laramiense]
MNIKYIKKMTTSKEIMEEMPLSNKIKEIKKNRDAEIRKVFENKSDKFLLIVGPCSADNEDSVCEYIGKLAKVQEKVKDSIIIIPRIYTNKPRTTGEGYKGMASQPDPSKEPDMDAGLRAIRKLHLKALSEYHMPAADEMLYPENYTYLSDLLSYHAVGARSVENQQHRFTVSGIDMPVGMKNPTGGDLTVMLNSIKAAQGAHTFIYSGWQVETSGNPLAHAVLRGAVDSYGKNIPNYHYEDLINIAKEYEKQKFENPSIIVDTNHANSMKHYEEQPRIAREVLMSRKYDSLLKKMIKGFMIESYLVEGKQDVSCGTYGKSITDACLGWEETEKLIYNIAENL